MFAIILKLSCYFNFAGQYYTMLRNTHDVSNLLAFVKTFAACQPKRQRKKSLISRDLLKPRHIKNQERFIARRFGVIVTPLSRD